MSDRRAIFLTFVMSAFLVCDCDGPIGPGPCVVEYREPVLHIISVTDADTGDPIPRIFISGIVINGTDCPLDYALLDSRNMEFQDTILVCTIPCSFGNEPGIYVLTISAEGYPESGLEVMNVHYSIREGPGCPLLLDGGTRVAFSLKREENAS